MERARGARALAGAKRAATIAAGAELGLALLAVWAANLGPTSAPWAALVALLVAAFLGLTLLSGLELLAGSADPAAGTHALVYEVVGGGPGFLTGWWTTTASLGLLALLSELAGAHAAALLSPWVSLDPRWLGLAILLGLVGVWLLGGEALPGWVWVPAALVALVLVVGLLQWLPPEVGLRQPPLPALAGWLTLAYAPLELILTLRPWARARFLRGGPGSLWRQPFAVELLVLLVPLVGVVLLLPALVEAQDTAPALRLAWLASPPRGSSWGLAVVLLGLVLGQSSALRLWVRGVRTMARFGGLPPALGHSWRSNMVPLWPIVLALAGTGFLMWAVPDDWLADAVRLAWLIPPLALSAAAVYSRQTEPGRRRPFRVPFHPLVPVAALTLGAVLLAGLPRTAWLEGLVWSAVGMLVYVAYARDRQVAVQVGASVFAGPGLPPKPEGGFRVLVPLRSASAWERDQVFPLALALTQSGGDVLLLRVIPVPDPLAIEESRRLAQREDESFRWAVVAGEAAENVHPVTRLARTRVEGILDTAEEADCDLILLAAEVREGRRSLGQVADPVVRSATSDVAVVMRPEAGAPAIGVLRRILLATKGGTHAPLCARLALMLGRSFGAEVVVVSVVDPEAPAEEVREAEDAVARVLELLRQEAQDLDAEDVPVAGGVLRGDRPADRIVEVAADYDLVVMGASEMSVLDRVLFGTVPEAVARSGVAPVLLARHYAGLPRFWLRRLWEALYLSIPQLDTEEQVEVYRQIRRGARPRVDFLIMIGLASLIATFGLLQNNTAVIIGAMVVAPLFTPAVALGLAIAHGDLGILRVALESMLKGVFVALVLSFLIGAAVPLRTITPEMLFRTQPGLLDLGVALVAGVAGAYAASRKEVSSSLAGVAIAATLVPPLEVAGLSVAWGEWELAVGASLLFAVNLAALALSGAVMFLLVGFRPNPRHHGEERLRWGLILGLLAVLIVTVPLALVSQRSLRLFRAERTLQVVLAEYLEGRPELRLADTVVEEVEGYLDVTVTIAAPSAIPPEEVAQLEQELEERTGQAVRLGLVVWPLIRPPDSG
ncbi:MAG: TIGR00341 family protein [Anaerolineae bacterium]